MIPKARITRDDLIGGLKDLPEEIRVDAERRLRDFDAYMRDPESVWDFMEEVERLRLALLSIAEMGQNPGLADKDFIRLQRDSALRAANWPVKKPHPTLIQGGLA